MPDDRAGDDANAVDDTAEPVPPPSIMQVKIEDNMSSDDEASLFEDRKPAAKPPTEPSDGFEDEPSRREPDC